MHVGAGGTCGCFWTLANYRILWTAETRRRCASLLIWDLLPLTTAVRVIGFGIFSGLSPFASPFYAPLDLSGEFETSVDVEEARRCLTAERIIYDKGPQAYPEGTG